MNTLDPGSPLEFANQARHASIGSIRHVRQQDGYVQAKFSAMLDSGLFP